VDVVAGVASISAASDRRLRRFMPAIAIGIVAAIAFGTYSTVQTVTEDNVRMALLHEQQQRQIENTADLGNQLQSDLYRIVGRLQLLASQPSIQNGDLTTAETAVLLKSADEELNEVTLIDGIIILDSENVVRYSTNYPELVGINPSFSDYILDAHQFSAPTVSEGLLGSNGKFGLGIAVPITNEVDGTYVGTIVSAVVAQEFFERYGNIRNIQISSIIALDKEGVVLAAGLSDVIGQEFFGEQIQSAIGRNPELNRLYGNVLAGRPDSALFTANLGERFSSGVPIFFNGEQVMSVVITTPTAAIYSHVNDVLLIQRIETIGVLTAMVVAVSVLVIRLSRWNKILEAKVELRTGELNKTNDRLQKALGALEETNERLKLRDKAQQEFINVAAHELRTPVAPILMMSRFLDKNSNPGAKQVVMPREDLEVILRSARRLKALTNDILDTAKIESQCLTLNKVNCDLDEVLSPIIDDARNEGARIGIVRILYEPRHIGLCVDKEKVAQVASNLLNNAIKFMKQGTISVKSEVAQQDGRSLVIITIADTGTGIDAEILPRLFTKFATKTEAGTGTGLGLYISKSIAEAHGGKIWGRNNEDGPGATFGFSLPLD
jgi:signal transduction histidine kinase